MRASSRVLSIRYLSFSTHQSERLCGAWCVHAGCCASAVRAVPRFARVDAAARDHIAASPRGLGLACGDASTPRAARARAAARAPLGKGLWRGVGEPLFSPCQKGINEFVSGSHVAELIQHQKVIDFTARIPMATTQHLDLLRPSTRISRGHTPPHGQTPSGPHTAAHSPALTSIFCCAAPNGRYSIAGSNTSRR